MMVIKKRLLLLFILYFPFLLSAQQVQIDSLQALLPKTTQDTSRTEIWNLISTYYLHIKPDSTISYAEKADFLAKKIKHKKQEYTAIYNKGRGHWKKGNLAKALQFLRESLLLAQEAKDQAALTSIINIIALVYENMGNYAVSTAYYHQLLLIAQEQKNEMRLGITYHNIGQAYTNLGKPDSAEYFLFKSIPYAQKYVKALEVFAYFNLGDSKWRKKEYDSAQFYLERTIELAKQHDDQENLADSYRILASINLEKGNFDLAEKQIREALPIVEKSQIKKNMYSVYQVYSSVLEKKGEYKNALKYNNLYILYKDSVQSETMNNSLQLFEYEKTQGEVAVMRAEQLEEKAKQRLWFFAFLGGFLFVLIIAMLVFRSRSKIQAAYQQLFLANAEVQQQKEELAVMNEELQQTQEEILSQKELLEQKNNLLEQYTHKIGKSIRAALLIQKAILPPKTKMKELFAEHFVLFKPKDVVSGDFWWASEIGKEKYLIVADCTGHGVAGAMLTMIGSALLDRIIRQMEITEPANILEELHQKIRTLLQQDQTQNNEGMDIAIVRWHTENREIYLTFSAAKRPLYYAFQGQIEKVHGTRRNIGGADSTKSFETKTLILEQGTVFYLSTDGYADQNDPERNSFSEKRFLGMLSIIQKKTFLEQKIFLKEALDKHMAGVEQRDDILVIGVQL